jgi:DNA-binding NarL/FixJ family response regulator
MSTSATELGTAVLVADSNRIQAQLLTGALRRRPEFQVSTCTADFDSILQTISSAHIGVVLLSLCHSDGIVTQMAAMRRVHIFRPHVPKILLTESYDRDIVVTAFRSGARGIFCLADTQFRLLCRCIQRVAGGQIWANTEQLNFLLDVISEVPSMRVVNSRGLQILTPREEQVVALVSESRSNREIALKLDLSEHTVKKYVFRIFEKLGISSRVELALYAVNNGVARQAETVDGVTHAIREA